MERRRRRPPRSAGGGVTSDEGGTPRRGLIMAITRARGLARAREGAVRRACSARRPRIGAPRGRGSGADPDRDHGAEPMARGYGRAGDTHRVEWRSTGTCSGSSRLGVAAGGVGAPRARRPGRRARRERCCCRAVLPSRWSRVGDRSVPSVPRRRLRLPRRLRQAIPAAVLAAVVLQPIRPGHLAVVAAPCGAVVPVGRVAPNGRPQAPGEGRRAAAATASCSWSAIDGPTAGSAEARPRRRAAARARRALGGRPEWSRDECVPCWTPWRRSIATGAYPDVDDIPAPRPVLLRRGARDRVRSSFPAMRAVGACRAIRYTIFGMSGEHLAPTPPPSSRCSRTWTSSRRRRTSPATGWNAHPIKLPCSRGETAVRGGRRRMYFVSSTSRTEPRACAGDLRAGRGVDRRVRGLRRRGATPARLRPPGLRPPRRRLRSHPRRGWDG